LEEEDNIDRGYRSCYTFFVTSLSLKELIMNKQVDVLDANARAIIAFSLSIIALVLVYLTFFK